MNYFSEIFNIFFTFLKIVVNINASLYVTNASNRFKYVNLMMGENNVQYISQRMSCTYGIQVLLQIYSLSQIYIHVDYNDLYKVIQLDVNMDRPTNILILK